jgi:hypothetical protein
MQVLSVAIFEKMPIQTALSSEISQCDTGIENNQLNLSDFNRTLVALDLVVAVKEVLERSDRSLLLVAVTQRDPLAVLGEADCKSVFLRQYTEHTVMGRA